MKKVRRLLNHSATTNKNFNFVAFIKKRWPIIFSIAALSIIPIYYLTKEQKTIYYCIDRYKTYLEAKKKFKNDITALQNYFVEEVAKYEKNQEFNKGYQTETSWYQKDDDWYKDYSNVAFTYGNEDITEQIEYTNKPCVINKKEKSITCEIGYFTRNIYNFPVRFKWYEVYTYLEGNFQKMVLLEHPNIATRNDVDVCYIKGKQPFQDMMQEKE